MTTSLTLAKRLRALPDEQLRALLGTRVVNTAGLRDFFDVADALLSYDSMTIALARQPRGVLDALLAGTIGTAEKRFLESSLLNVEHNSSTPCPELQSLLGTLDYSWALADSPIDPVDAPVSGTSAHAALENALGIVQAIDELAREIDVRPVTELSRGGLAAGDKARLELLLPSPEMDSLILLHLAAETGVLRCEDGNWNSGPALSEWRAHTTAQKWLSLAQAWWFSLNDAERRALGIRLSWGPTLRSWVAHEYPLEHSWLDSLLDAHLPQAQLLGLSVAGVATDVAREITTEDWSSALARVSTLVPEYAAQVYVQHDLTVVAPGPLKPEDDEFMRTLCVVESRGLASTFRMTQAGVNHLLSSGYTADQILGHLTALSATEIPQAVSYLISDTAAKFGSVRVRSHGTFTTVSTTDPLILQMIATDRSLHALGLKTHGEKELACAHPAYVVHAALTEAKYPAQCEDAHGNIITSGAPIESHRRELKKSSSRSRSTSHTGAIAVNNLLERLRATTEGTSSADAAVWIARQVDLAVRDRGVLDVSVTMPDGSTKNLTIEPKGVSNGRLRAKDRATEVERTLPLSSITSVRRV